MADALYQSRDGFDKKINGADVFIQWKGTNICADFHCECGEHHHICNELFVYAIQCTCGAVYEMPHTVRVVRLPQKSKSPVYICKTEGGRDE